MLILIKSAQILPSPNKPNIVFFDLYFRPIDFILIPIRRPICDIFLKFCKHIVSDVMWFSAKNS